MKTNKYNYYKVIQGNYGQGWEDEDFHETLSNYTFTSSEKYKLFKTNLKAYHENGGGTYRIVKRRERKE